MFIHVNDQLEQERCVGQKIFDSYIITWFFLHLIFRLLFQMIDLFL